MNNAATATLMRRRQRRPDLQSTFDVPQDVHQLLERVAHVLRRECPPSEQAKKIIRVTDAALQEFLQPSLTPEKQLHAVSKITGVLHEVPKTVVASLLTDTEAELHSWGRTLALSIVVPLLLDCRVRYLHRALMTLLRVLIPNPDDSTESMVREMYLHRVLQNAEDNMPKFHRADTPHAAATQYFPCASDATAMKEGGADRDGVLNFLNTVDGLTSTLIPMMPTIFHDTFLGMLPLLADCLQWAVINATSHSCLPSVDPGARRGDDDGDGGGGGTPSTATANVAVTEAPVMTGEEEEIVTGGRKDADRRHLLGGTRGGAVFGEDLEYIRFCIRVVATYIHKYLGVLATAVASSESDDVADKLTRLLQPTLVMLASPAFPKDVLNAVGLLVASILTVRSCNAWLLGSVCAALQDRLKESVSTTAMEGLSGKETDTSISLESFFAQASRALLVVLAVMPQAEAMRGGGTGARALHDVFSHLTPNGCFALFKGILAHTSGLICGSWTSLGVLLVPQSFSLSIVRGQQQRRESATDVIAFDVIIPAAQLYCNVVQEPETRFMAIQTVDGVVRHIHSVLTCAAKEMQQSGSKHTEVVRRLVSFCVGSRKLQSTLAFATQLMMALWDDGTQQMSGALYNTYDEILSINVLLHRLASQVPDVVHDQVAGEPMHVPDAAATLEHVLQVQAERRGKYHALLGLLSVMPLADVVAVLQKCFHSSSSAVAAVALFSRSLLEGASNHKIGNVAGDVFARLARSIAGATPAQPLTSSSLHESAVEVLQGGIIEPLVRAITEKQYVGVASNVSEAVNISHITAHFVAPLVKQYPPSLQMVLSAIASRSERKADATSRQGDSRTACAAHDSERVEQGVVEVLSRAHSIGVDITPYLAPGSRVLRVLEDSCHSLHCEVRNAALCLCVLNTRKLQAVQPWQVHQVEEYLILNMHLGGDGTARKGLLETLKKWMRRLMESVTSKDVCGSDGGKVPSLKTEKRRERAAAGASESGISAPASTSSDAQKLEVGTPAYCEAVTRHCRRLAVIFAQNIGVSARAGRGLAVERRVTAMAGYTLFLQGLRAHGGALVNGEWTASTVDALPFVHVEVVPSLLETLSDGWSQARDGARELLNLFSALAPIAVLREAESALTQHSDDLSLSSTSGEVVKRAQNELRHAQTFRNAEGSVARFLFFSTRTAEAQAAAVETPLQELERLRSMLEAERTVVWGRCTDMRSLRGSEAYAFIQARPLHGSLSLCGNLLSLMAVVGRQTTVSSIAPTCTDLLECCCLVLHTCSSLVGTETVSSATGAAGAAAPEVVDCRGHVYDRSRPEAESVMRGVVNNTWLSMRVATETMTRILEVCPVHEMPFKAVHMAAYELVGALLLTKHNGVMRCLRATLQALAAALVRCRQRLFYQLPAELLEYLMGPEGVTSDDMARMLRRSQGLPHAILAVLEAEDSAVPYVLFPAAMQRLLCVARGDTAASEGSPESDVAAGPETSSATVRRSQRSNALNVMKFIFENKVFADRIVAYIEDAFSLATDGFHDASWYTRNSSLMLFSAVIHRFVGEHPSTGGSGVNTSLYDVAKRTPRGVAYAYAELTRSNGLECTSSENAGGSGTASVAEVNVALFPVLQLLSLLSPDPPHLITKVSHGEQDDAARLSEAVMRCGDSPSLMVRSASAVALRCLVPLAALSQMLTQTRRGLLMKPLPDPTYRDTAKASADSWSTSLQRGAGGGLNACHGALLQLSQFHEHYVGTVRRQYRMKRASGVPPSGTETVSCTIASVLLSSQHVLLRACAVCPTVAAALFGLLADLVYHGPPDSTDQEQQGALRRMWVKAASAYFAANLGLVERGSVLEGVSAGLLFSALRSEGTVRRWSPEEQHCLGNILSEESAATAIHRGEHNLVSWIMAQLLYYGEESGFLTTADVAAVVSVLSSELDCSLLDLALNALIHQLGGDAAENRGRPDLTSMECTAWALLVTYLRFAAMMTRLPQSTPDGAAVPLPFERVSQPATEPAGVDVPPSSQLYEILYRLVAAPALDSAVALSPLQRNVAACSAAIDFMATYDMHLSERPLSISVAVARVLSFYCHPAQPLECRLAVVKALHTALPFLRNSVEVFDPPASSQFPAAAVTLLVVIWQLLVDDTSDIREAAAAVCTRCVWGLHAAPRDQASCLLAVVRVLRRLRLAGHLESPAEVKVMFGLTDAMDDVVAAGGAEGQEDDDEEERTDKVGGDEEHGAADEDVLFRKEAANMFAEETVLSRLFAYIYVDTAEAATDSFSVYDPMLAC